MLKGQDERKRKEKKKRAMWAGMEWPSIADL